MIRTWNTQAQNYAQLADSKIDDAVEYEINVPSILKLCPKSANNVLDLGCGNGVLISSLKKIYKNIDACDGAATMIAIAKQNHPNLEFFTLDLENKFNLKKHYDLIICKMVLMFVKNIKKVATECIGTLNKSGHLIVSVPHPFYWTSYYLQNKYKVKDCPEFAVMSKGYFSEVPISKSLGRNKELVFEYIHRTFSTYINAFASEGFVVDKIDEPTITPKFISKNPNYAKKFDIPMRLNIRFKKV